MIKSLSLEADIGRMPASEMERSGIEPPCVVSRSFHSREARSEAESSCPAL